MPDVAGRPRPLEAPFAGQVFKIQANLDARHRDRVAFVRVNSGRFVRGMPVTVQRTSRAFTTTGKPKSPWWVSNASASLARTV